jgi:hypothetical protein
MSFPADTDENGKIRKRESFRCLINIYKKAAVAVVLLTLTACGVIALQREEPTALKSSDHVVVPGDRIGPVSLGLSPKAVFQLLGPPNWTGTSAFLWRYGDSSFFVRVDDGHRQVVQVAVYNDASFHTAEGARYGSTLQDLDQIWGAPYKMESYDFWPSRGKPIKAGFEKGGVAFFFEPPSGEIDWPPEGGVAVVSVQRAWEEALSY